MKTEEASPPLWQSLRQFRIFGGLDARDDLLLKAILKLGIKLVCF